MRKGFSLVELLVVVGLIVTLGAISALSLAGKRNKTALEQARIQIVSLLGDARSRSINQEEDAAWGVHFANNATTSFYAIFMNAYSTSTEKGHYPLPEGVAFASSTFPIGSTHRIMFRELTGISSSTTSSIPLVSKVYPFTTSTITVSTSGVVSF